MSEEVIKSEVDVFLEALKVVSAGEPARDAAYNLKECIKATMETGKKSSINFKLEIEQAAEGSINIIGIVTSKVPQVKLITTFHVSDKTFLPTKEDPNRPTLPMSDE